jgi:hypothetical protein
MALSRQLRDHGVTNAFAGVWLTKESALTETATAPAVTGFHHFSATVSDVEASAQWYERVFRMNRVPGPRPLGQLA